MRGKRLAKSFFAKLLNEQRAVGKGVVAWRLKEEKSFVGGANGGKNGLKNESARLAQNASGAARAGSVMLLGARRTAVGF